MRVAVVGAGTGGAARRCSWPATATTSRSSSGFRTRDRSAPGSCCSRSGQRILGHARARRRARREVDAGPLDRRTRRRPERPRRAGASGTAMPARRTLGWASTAGRCSGCSGGARPRPACRSGSAGRSRGRPPRPRRRLARRAGRCSRRSVRPRRRGRRRAIADPAPARARVQGRPLPLRRVWTVIPGSRRLVGDVLVQRYRDTRTTLGFLPTGVGEVSIFWSMRTREMAAAVRAGPDWLVERALPLAPDLAPLLERVRSSTVLGAAYRDVVCRSPTLVRWPVRGRAAWRRGPRDEPAARDGREPRARGCLVARRGASATPSPRDLGRALDRYADDRRAHVRWYTWLSRIMTPVFQSDLVPVGWARDLFFGPAANLALVRRQFAAILLGEQTSPFTRWGPTNDAVRELAGGLVTRDGHAGVSPGIDDDDDRCADRPRSSPPGLRRRVSAEPSVAPHRAATDRPAGHPASPRAPPRQRPRSSPSSGRGDRRRLRPTRVRRSSATRSPRRRASARRRRRLGRGHLVHGPAERDARLARPRRPARSARRSSRTAPRRTASSPAPTARRGSPTRASRRSSGSRRATSTSTSSPSRARSRRTPASSITTGSCGSPARPGSSAGSIPRPATSRRSPRPAGPGRTASRSRPRTSLVRLARSRATSARSTRRTGDDQGRRAADGRRGHAAGLVRTRPGGSGSATGTPGMVARLRPGRRLVAGVGPAGRRQPGLLDVRRRARRGLAHRLRPERDRAVRPGDRDVRVVPVRSVERRGAPDARPAGRGLGRRVRPRPARRRAGTAPVVAGTAAGRGPMRFAADQPPADARRFVFSSEGQRQHRDGDRRRGSRSPTRSCRSRRGRTPSKTGAAAARR